MKSRKGAITDQNVNVVAEWEVAEGMVAETRLLQAAIAYTHSLSDNAVSVVPQEVESAVLAMCMKCLTCLPLFTATCRSKSFLAETLSASVTELAYVHCHDWFKVLAAISCIRIEV